MREITVTYMVSDDQIKRFEAILPFFNQYIGMEDWTAEELFRSIMTNGSNGEIDSRLHWLEQMVAAQNEAPAAGTAGE